VSLDSVTRIDAFFKAQITDLLGIETIFEDQNKGQFEPGGGMFIKMWVEPSFDELTGSSLPDSLYTEDGLIVIQVFTIKGQGTKNLYALESVGTSIRNAFRDVFLNPTGSEEGAIYFEDVSTRQTIEIGRQNSSQGRGSSFDGVWKRKDIFINYQKSYRIITFTIPVNLTIPVVTGDAGSTGNLMTTTDGTWTQSPTSFTYRWLRDDVAISGATASTYTTVLADDNTTLKSEVVAINVADSSLPAESVGTAIGAGNVPQDLGFLFSYQMNLAANVTDFADFGIAPSLEGWLSAVTGNNDAAQTTPANQPTSDADGPVTISTNQGFDSIVVSDSQCTFMVNIKETSSTSFPLICSSKLTDSSNSGMQVVFNSTARTQIAFRGSNGAVFLVVSLGLDAANVSTTMWFVFTGTVWKLYVNDTFVTDINTTYIASTEMYRLFTGSATGESRYAGYAPTALNATQISDAYDYYEANS